MIMVNQERKAHKVTENLITCIGFYFNEFLKGKEEEALKSSMMDI